MAKTLSQLARLPLALKPGSVRVLVYIVCTYHPKLKESARRKGHNFNDAMALYPISTYHPLNIKAKFPILANHAGGYRGLEHNRFNIREPITDDSFAMSRVHQVRLSCICCHVKGLLGGANLLDVARISKPLFNPAHHETESNRDQTVIDSWKQARRQRACNHYAQEGCGG